jgi:hypothetical protein
MRIKVASLGTYTSAIKDHANLYEGGWHLDGSDVIRRTMRYVTRRYPCAQVGLKFAISLDVLGKLAPFLSGWPHLCALSYPDLLWITASVVAVCAFLRGGEFVIAPGSTRPVLMASHISIRYINLIETLVVSIPQPKGREEFTVVDVPCFSKSKYDPLSPLVLWRALRDRIFIKYIQSEVAFPLPSGLPLSRLWLADMTCKLLSLANIPITDSKGRATTVKMASWRAGAVSSAIKAGVSEALIMELGRWRSYAWRHYLLHSPTDLQDAGLQLWSGMSLDSGLGVGAVSSTGPGGDCTASAVAVVPAKPRRKVVLNLFPMPR